MFKKLLSLIVSVLFMVANTSHAHAVEDPLTVPNNPYGIHIFDEHDLEDAALLVNSNGGDWGYVTLVIREDERDTQRWQKVFDKMRELHLIPIVRMATVQENGGWRKPNMEDVDGWVGFFNSLNWVIKNRYIIIGNEPNHASEWGGEVDPEGYADYLFNVSKRLKNESRDYFILPAGFDASAPDLNNHMDEAGFIKRMIEHNPDSFDHIDGWASHSYPNPGFAGSSYDTGRGTIRTYIWELNYLSSLGINKYLPVFITETGWVHNMDKKVLGVKNTRNVADDFKIAYLNTWNDSRIVAITPFILNYQNPPFDKFSWKDKEGKYYDFYYTVQTIPKTKGEPKQIIEGEVITTLVPKLFSRNEKSYGMGLVKNTGQAVWEKGSDIKIAKKDSDSSISPYLLLSDIRPGDTSVIIFNEE